MFETILQTIKLFTNLEILGAIFIYTILLIGIMLVSVVLFSKDKVLSAITVMLVAPFIQGIAFGLMLTATLPVILTGESILPIDKIVELLPLIIKVSIAGTIIIVLIGIIPLLNSLLNIAMVSEFILGVIIFNGIIRSIASDNIPLKFRSFLDSLGILVLSGILGVIVMFLISFVSMLLFGEQGEGFQSIVLMLIGGVLSLFPIFVYIVLFKQINNPLIIFYLIKKLL